jgi:hypothetical protein
MATLKTIGDVQRGDIVRFKGHALRVEAEPVRRNGRVRLEGRENRDGCPYVQRWYFANLPVTVERS